MASQGKAEEDMWPWAGRMWAKKTGGHRLKNRAEEER